MAQKATGAFEVKIVPQQDAEMTVPARMTLDKTFRGDLEAVSKGIMLSVRTAIPNSAGYVAMEQVEGTLHGKKGSFALQHSGTMNRGEASLKVTVVPDSGTDDLTGLSGTLAIIIEGGKHSYEFDYDILA